MNLSPFCISAILLGAVAVVKSQTPNSCMKDIHFNDEDGYYTEGVAGLSTKLDLDSAHGQKLPNTTWMAGIEYPHGQYKLCANPDPRFCSASCSTAPGCRQWFGSTTCSILTFCNPPGMTDAQEIYLMDTFEALEACDFSQAKLLGSTTGSSDSRQGAQDLCFEYPFEIDHELSAYFFSTPGGCSLGQKIAVNVSDYFLTADQCELIGLTSPRLRNCDCRLETSPSTLGEPCRTEFSDACATIMQTDRPTADCCQQGNCISTIQDYSHPTGKAVEDNRIEACDDDIPGTCYNEDGSGTDTNGMGSIDCCTKTCSACGTKDSGPFTEWKPCTANVNSTHGNCGFLSRYDRSPYQCDFSKCATGDKWHHLGSSFRSWAGIGAPGFGICFAGDSEVMVSGSGRPTKMKDLKIGDSVLVDEKGNYATTHSFGHYNPSIKADYLQIYSKDTDKPLVLSASHLVFVQDDDDNNMRTALPASLVRVGDLVITVGGEVTEVTRVSNTKDMGAFAPFTSTGTIVVNGIVASNYVAIEEAKTFAGFGSHQWMAHTFEAPHRLYCRLMDCSNEKYDQDGISTWVTTPGLFAGWLAEQHMMVKIASLVPIMAVLVVFALVETATFHYQLLAVVVVLALRRRHRQTSSKCAA